MERQKISDRDLQGLKASLAELDLKIARESYLGDALNGAALGAAIALLAHRGEGHKYVLKHALWGAGICAGLGFVSKQIGKAFSAVGHTFEHVAEEGRARAWQAQAQAQAQAQGYPDMSYYTGQTMTERGLAYRAPPMMRGARMGGFRARGEGEGEAFAGVQSTSMYSPWSYYTS